MKQITKTRKAVATMANQLHRLGYSLSKTLKMVLKREKIGLS